MFTWRQTLAIVLSVLFTACAGEPEIVDGSSPEWTATAGKADDGTGRAYQVLLTNPHCDICSGDDKAYLKPRSAITARVVELLDNAQHTIDIAQFTFSVTDIEAAILRAHERGVTIRMAMNEAQSFDRNNVSNRLKDAGVNVQFVAGKAIQSADYSGLMHAKFMLVDGQTLVHGSNNWSSTGTSINEENTMVIQAPQDDSLLRAFGCHFTAIWEKNPDASGGCSTDDVAFTPSSRPLGMLKSAIRGAEHSIDVLMHHFLFTQLVKELAKAAERGVAVRVVVNAPDRHEVTGSAWDRLLAAGATVRFKQVNEGTYQLMHHKLAIFDNTVLINGSGNWSGSAFFNNFEFYVRYHSPSVVGAFVGLYNRLWSWSLTAESLDMSRTAAEQDAAETQVFLGNLHAHFAHEEEGHLLDDGKLERVDQHGNAVDVAAEVLHGDGARYAYEYARDRGAMDFMALTPHVVDDAPDSAPDQPNMNTQGYYHLLTLAESVTDESDGQFVALPGMEWSTNSTGNHVTVLGSKELCKVLRGRFDLFYEEFLPHVARGGEKPMVIFNHPRTFRQQTEFLTGNWDQIFDVNLSEIPKNSQRKNKFNDFGLDDYPPLNEVLGQWIAGQGEPDRQTVADTLSNIQKASQPYLRLMEVTIGRGKDINHELHQNPSLSQWSDEAELTRHTRVHTDWDYYLLNGFRMAPSAPHDNHFANWGTGHSSRTGILATALTEESVLDAIDRRAVFASEDENLQIRLYANGRVPMGSEMTTLSDTVSLNLLVADPDYDGGYEVTIWQGTVGGSSVDSVHSTTVSGDTWTELDVTVFGEGTHFVYLEIYEPAPNRMAWSAPIWINRPAL